MNKPILCIDFDGVIHSYENGWQNGEIYGTATPGFFRWADKAMDHFKLVIYSSRSKTPEGITAMREAIGKWSVDAVNNREVVPEYEWSTFFNELEFTDVKPAAFLTIDDRAICFQGNWDTVLDPVELLEFRTWTQIDRKSPAGEFADDYNRMIATVSNFCAKHDVKTPDMLFGRDMLAKMCASSDVPLLGTLIFRGVRVRFGQIEQADVLRTV